MKDSLSAGDFLDISFPILLWVEKACINELLTPGDIFLSLDSVKELLEGFSLLQLLCIGDNLDHKGVLFRDFDDFWTWGLKLDSENLISL